MIKIILIVTVIQEVQRKNKKKIQFQDKITIILKYNNDDNSISKASLSDKLDKIRDYIIKILNNNYEINKTVLLEIKEIVENGEIYES